MLSPSFLGLVKKIGLGTLTFGLILVAYAQFGTPATPRGGPDLVAEPNATQPASVSLTRSPVPVGTVIAPAHDPRLTRGTWHWQRTERGDGTTVVSSNPSKFTISFGADGSFSVKTNCNGAGGRYTVSGSQLTFEKAPMTLMGCPNVPQPPQEWVFYGAVTDTASYAFEGEQLILYLKQDGGHVVLTPRPA